MDAVCAASRVPPHVSLPSLSRPLPVFGAPAVSLLFTGVLCGFEGGERVKFQCLGDDSGAEGILSVF